MTKDEVQKLAEAIAVANGHPTPVEWSEAVAEAFEPADKGDPS